MSEITPLIKAALNLRVGAGFDVYRIFLFQEEGKLAKLTTIQGKRDWRLSVRKLETVLSRCRDISRWLI